MPARRRLRPGTERPGEGVESPGTAGATTAGIKARKGLETVKRWEVGENCRRY